MTNLATPSYPVNLAPLRKMAATIPRGSRNDYQMWKLAFAQTQDVRFRDLNRMVWGAPDGSGQVDSDKLLRDAIAADAAARAAFDAFNNRDAYPTEPDHLDAMFAMKWTARDLCYLQYQIKKLTDHRAAGRLRRKLIARDRARELTNRRAERAAGIVRHFPSRKPTIRGNDPHDSQT